jgi:hypothetical protein
MTRKSSFPFFHTIMHNGAYGVGSATNPTSGSDKGSLLTSQARPATRLCFWSHRDASPFRSTMRNVGRMQELSCQGAHGDNKQLRTRVEIS